MPKVSLKQKEQVRLVLSKEAFLKQQAFQRVLLLEHTLGWLVADPSRGGMQPVVPLFAHDFVEMQLENKSPSSRKHLLTFVQWPGSRLDAVSPENSICLVCLSDLMQVP